MKYQVFFFEVFQEEEQKLRQLLPTDIQIGYTDKTIQEWMNYQKKVCPAHLLSIRTQSIIPDCWTNTGYIKGILSRSTGYDHLSIYKPIKCGYLPCYCSKAVAEQATLLWMSLLKKLPQQISQWRTFNRDHITCSEFGTGNKVMLVVGVGNIGYQVSKIAQALNINVYGVDIVEKHPDIEYIDSKDSNNLIKFLNKVDIIVCCMNLTRDNQNYFDYQLLSNVKKGAIFVNVSRGELANCNDLHRLLEEKHLGGVGMDVYPKENQLGVKLRKRIRDTRIRFTDQEIAILKMADMPNVILTPHNAFNTYEGLNRKVKDTIKQVISFLETGDFVWNIC